MKTHISRPLRSNSVMYSLVLLSMLVLTLMSFSGCMKNEPAKELKPEVTLQNLQTAYIREMRISREYALFSQKAEKGKNIGIAKLFKAASRTEQIHAEMAASLLRSKAVVVTSFVPDSIAVGTVVQTLRLAISDEGLETESMYPNLARTAEAEKFSEAVASFAHAQKADKRHVELFKEALDKNGSVGKIQYYVCPNCGYIITSDKADECPNCQTKKEKFEKI